MKYSNKLIVFFLFLLFNHGADTFAYTYKIYNGTGGDVHVRLYYVFGQLTNYSHLIKANSTDTLRFGRGEAGLCLSKVMVRQKRLNGSWGRAKKAKIGSIKAKELRNVLIALAVIGVAATGVVPVASWGYGIYYGIRGSMCRNRDFTLIINPKSAEVETIYIW